MVGACTSAKHRADLGTKALPVHRLRQLTQWNGLVLGQGEDAVNGEKKDGQDEDERRRAAVHTISDLGQGDGGALEAQGNLVRAIRWTKCV